MTINKSIVFSVVGALLFGASSMASADELLVTAGTAKKGGNIALDIMTEGSTVAFQFNILLPKGVTVAKAEVFRRSAVWLIFLRPIRASATWLMGRLSVWFTMIRTWHCHKAWFPSARSASIRRLAQRLD
ncbi:MAG: hypothetical protein R3F10_03350 [Lysobacteraceae bacterium]